MAYSSITDFLALVRNTPGGERFTSLPGLDFVVAALARAGLITLVVSETPPVVNQQTTAWFQPSSPSWVAEGTLWLWNANIGGYAPATPALWAALIGGGGGGGGGGYLFQSVQAANGIIGVGTTILAVQRDAPAATSLVLPSLASQFTTGRTLKIIDWSTNVANHDITLTTPDGASIMKQNTWQMFSNAAQLASLALYPSPDLNGWVIA